MEIGQDYSDQLSHCLSNTSLCLLMLIVIRYYCAGLKKFSNWPTYPQLYVNGELIGGLDIIKVKH